MLKRMTLKQISIIFTFIVLSSCGHVSTDKKTTIDPDARALNDSAVALHMTFNKENTMKAIELLDKATKIDPGYFLAHWNKYVFQNELNMKEQAFETLKTLELLTPENPELKMASGVFHENIGDSSTAFQKYQRANSIYESNLDTLAKNGIQYSMLQSNRAINLILLGRESQGKEILNDLLQNESDEATKELIKEFLTLSRQDLLDGKMNKN
jgi:tetratricopeptide (TPR) repeat protein